MNEPDRPKSAAARRLVMLMVFCYVPAGALVLTGVVWSLGLLGGGVRETPLALALSVLVMLMLLLPIAWSLATSGSGSSRLGGGIDALQHEVKRLVEQAALSDDARRVLNRSHERWLLRSAIEEDISREDWEAAVVLVDELANRFGYRADAEEFRSRIEAARSSRRDTEVRGAVTHITHLIEQRRWEPALQEAQRLARVYPEHGEASMQTGRVLDTRALYKSELESRFREAAEAELIDEAMVLLKELDAYLTEFEAEPIKEVARTVIAKSRDSLGTKFKLAVKDRQWDTAQLLGNRIMREFPNSRMATEVRTVLDTIAERDAG